MTVKPTPEGDDMESMSIRKHLEKAEGEETLRVTVRIPASLHAKVEAQMEKDDVKSWNRLLIACLEAYLEEAAGKKKG